MAIQEDPPAGVPEWVVTYGDMMSLLLTFFIMLVSLSEVNANEKFRKILEALQQAVGYRLGHLGPPGTHFPLNSMVAGLDVLGSFSANDKGRGGQKTEGPEGQDTRTFRTRDGDAIHVGKAIYFEPDSIVLDESAFAELKTIAEKIAGKANKIDLRAHCGPEPLPPGSPFLDKYVLTYRRARAAQQFLLRHGIDEKRIRLTALADVEPLKDNGDRQAYRLDRVEVVQLNEFVKNFVGPSDSAR